MTGAGKFGPRERILAAQDGNQRDERTVSRSMVLSSLSGFRSLVNGSTLGLPKRMTIRNGSSGPHPIAAMGRTTLRSNERRTEDGYLRYRYQETTSITCTPRKLRQTRK